MFLSKSDYMTAYNCVKALWLKKNRKDLIPIINEAQQTSFDIGNEVQELARQYFDNGIMVNAEPWDVINGVILPISATVRRSGRLRPRYPDS